MRTASIQHEHHTPEIFRSTAVVRHRFFIVAELLLLVIALLVDALVKSHPGPLPFDPAGDRAVQTVVLPHHGLSAFLDWLSTINWPVPSAITMAALLLVLVLLRRTLGALIALVSTGLADGSNYVTSLIVRRPRPAGHGIHILQSVKGYYSYPSGHVEHVVAFYGFLLFLSFQTRRTDSWLWVIRALLAGMIILIPISRLLEGEHWTSDVLMGLVYGAFWLLIAAHVYQWARQRWPQWRPPDERTTTDQRSMGQSRSRRLPRDLRPDPTPVLDNAREQMSATPLPPGQQERRGRRFVHVYIAALGVAIIVFVALGLFAHSGNALLTIDVPVTRAIQGVKLPLYGWVLTHTSDFGFFPGNIIVYVVVFVGLAIAGLWAEAVLAVSSALLAGLVGGAIKVLVGRLRPTGHGVYVAGHVTGYSFPSGHVTQYTTLFGFAFFLVFVTWRGGWMRALILMILALLIVLVGPSRVYLGQHWPSDVLGAYLFAGVWLAGTIELDLFLRRRSRWTTLMTTLIMLKISWREKGEQRCSKDSIST